MQAWLALSMHIWSLFTVAAPLFEVANQLSRALDQGALFGRRPIGFFDCHLVLILCSMNIVHINMPICIMCKTDSGRSYTLFTALWIELWQSYSVELRCVSTSVLPMRLCLLRIICTRRTMTEANDKWKFRYCLSLFQHTGSYGEIMIRNLSFFMICDYIRTYVAEKYQLKTYLRLIIIKRCL